jgi:spore germination protein YaaH
MHRRFHAGLFIGIAGLLSCGRIPAAREPAFDVWHLASPGEGDMLVLDTTSLRPVVTRGELVSLDRIVRFSNFQGSRFHPEAVRAISEDPQVLDGFSRTLARSIPQNAALVIDVQDMAAEDVATLAAFVRALNGASRAIARSSAALIVPAGDTVAYPTQVLSRVVDLLVIRLWDEYRPGTRPGPPATPDFVRREIGSRSTAIGASRIAAYFPLYGYLWNRRDSARSITFEEANRMVLREAGAFRRDAASRFLTATGRDGWTVWVPDLTTINFLIEAARGRGARIIALSDFRGADPGIIRAYPIRR